MSRRSLRIFSGISSTTVHPLQHGSVWRLARSTAPCFTASRSFSSSVARHDKTLISRIKYHLRATTEAPTRAGSTALVAAGGSILALALAFIEPVQKEEDADESVHDVVSTENTESALKSEDGLPFIRLSEVKDHGATSEHPWVTYKGKVYDITDWIAAHPGGEVILRAAGADIEPYWDIFSIHKSQYVRDILEQYAIGHIHPDDLSEGVAQIEDPFATDPSRDEQLRFLTQKPCNAESPTEALSESFLTPNEIFYVRNHMWVPVVPEDEADDYEISVELPDGTLREYTMRELRSRFKQHAVTAVMQCSGNRRSDMTTHARKTNGLQWTVGAISCAEWEGVFLRDVLVDAGLPLTPQASPADPDAQHVQFSGAEAYGASIPITSALDPRGDVLLAFKMNGVPLPRDHGYPVRVIVPGHVAARCVKWLKKIVVSDEESYTTWQRKDYKCFGPNEIKQDWDKYKSIQKMPITSAITKVRLNHNVLKMEGYAYSGGGHEIQRVDVSLDAGKTWDQAALVQEDLKLEKGHGAWCWKRWKYEGTLNLNDMPEPSTPGGERRTTLMVKATDDAYNTQPETHGSIYNLRGNLATAWHRVDLDVNPQEERGRNQRPN